VVALGCSSVRCIGLLLFHSGREAVGGFQRVREDGTHYLPTEQHRNLASDYVGL
jgi:hypothetical protein